MMVTLVRCLYIRCRSHWTFLWYLILL